MMSQRKIAYTDLAIVVGSSDFFGAERRLLKIIQKIVSKRNVSLYLVVNSTLYLSSKNSPLARMVMDERRSANRLVVVPDRPSHLHLIRGVETLFRLVFGRKIALHAILRGRILAYLRAAIGGAATIEVTSPDIARRIVREVPAFLLQRVDRFVCVSPTAKRTLITSALAKGISLDEAKLSVATAAYYEPVAHRAPVEKERLLVSASRFIERKNVLVLAKAIALVADQLPDWKFAILGQGPEQAEIEAVLSPLIADERAVVGYVPQVSDYLARSAVYASVIEPDNYPSQSVLEAMSFGNALLLSDTGDSVERFIGGAGNGVAVPTPLTPEVLGEKLVSICSDWDRARSMGEASTDIVSTRYSAERFLDEMLMGHGFS